MYIQTKATESSVLAGKAILQFLLKDHHPRDYAFRFWNGTTWDAEAGQPTRFTMVLNHPGALRAMLRSPLERSMGQAYIFNDVDIEGSVESTLSMAEYLFALHLTLNDRIRLASKLLRLSSHRLPRSGRAAAKLKGNVHSLERDRQAVTYHYNTSNDLFAIYLGKQMVYSCAYFVSPDEDLDTAQERKLDYICRKLRLQRGEKFLDIGCGWGGLIIHAAKNFGVSATGITLSEPQAKLANERIKSEGLVDRCKAEVCDYRLIGPPDGYDKIASIGMVEHVGAAKLPEYFGAAWRLLRPGGVFLNHGITDHSDHSGPTFSQSFVFPDSEPVPLSVSTRIAEEAGFEVRDVECLREHYALTLRHWVRRLESHHAEAVRATDETTYRVWRLYMSAAAYQFVTKQTSVYQSLLVKPDNGKSGMPLTRSDWYK